MAIIKTGTVTVVAGGSAQNLNLGFVPSVFSMYNLTEMNAAAAADVDGVAYAYWDTALASLATPVTLIDTYTNGVPARSSITTGISAFQSDDANLWTPQQAPYTSIAGNRQYIQESTVLVITGLTNAANASVTATHSFTSADVGVTVVTFHGVPGMPQINGLSGVIQTVTSTTSFTVNINTTNFGTYDNTGTAGVNRGFCNVITGAPATSLYGNVNLPTASANLGFIGLTLGAGVMVTTNDVWVYNAMLVSPATGP